MIVSARSSSTRECHHGHAGKLICSAIRRKGLLNRITDRWWLILLLYIVVSTPLVLLILKFVEPTYEAFSLLQVQPISHELYGNLRAEAVDLKTVMPYFRTQVALITTDRVLTTALASPEIKKLQFMRESDNPTADVRKNLSIEIVQDAYLIRVALELPNGNEAAAIVNSVIIRTWHTAANSAVGKTQNCGRA